MDNTLGIWWDLGWDLVGVVDNEEMLCVVLVF